MTYYCEDCGFVFCRTGEIKECPYCGMNRIRVSSGEEVEKLRLFSGQEKSNCHTKEKDTTYKEGSKLKEERKS